MAIQHWPAHRFSVAPMMDLTNRHARYLMRLLTQQALLYTEMVTADALLRGDQDRLLAFNPEEHPLALQLGGSEPDKLAECCRIAAARGFDEINLNVGCPSDRVQAGRFGACLMLEPELVADCFAAMAEASPVPVTIKCRTGVDQQDVEQTLPRFIKTLAEAGCLSFAIHARKAWLQGLSPKQNREVPPLDYDLVYAIKRQYPELIIVINGGIQSLQECQRHLQQVDGVMLGRKAYYEPYLLAGVDAQLFDATGEPRTRRDVLLDYIDYARREVASGTALKHMSKHVLGLFHGVAGARAFRRHISEHAYKTDAGISVLEDALQALPAT